MLRSRNREKKNAFARPSFLLIPNPEPQQSPDRLKGIFQFDLFPLRIITWVEGNGHLKDAIVTLEYFCCKLWFKVEAFGFDRQPLDYLAAEDLITCFHVRQNGVVKNVGHEGQ